MITMKLVCDERRCNNVRIRITNNRRKAELATDMYLPPLDLDLALSPNPPKRLERLANVLAYWNKQLDALKMEIYQQGGRFMDVAEIKERVANKLFGRQIEKECRFVSLYRDFAASRRRKATQGCYSVALHTLMRYEPKVEYMLIQEIDYSLLRRYLNWLYGQDYSVGTISNYIFCIHAVIREAIRNEIIDRDPFIHLPRIVRRTKTRKRSLPADAIRAIFALTPSSARARVALDVFKLSFMLIGINSVDMLRLECLTTDGRIEYERCKTRKQYSIKVEPEALEIINRYKSDKHGQLLTFADIWNSRQAMCGAVSTALRKYAGRDDLTLYWARHSWATIAYSIGIPKDIISQALGHSFGVAITDVYIDYDNVKVDEANRRVLDWVLYGKR